MLTRDLTVTNMKIDVLYRREVGETRQAIATLHGISRWQVDTWEKAARRNPKIVDAVKMRLRRDNDQSF